MSEAAPLDKRGQFIKARKREVFEALSADLDLTTHGEAADKLYQMLVATIHYEYLAELEELHDAYHDLNPRVRGVTVEPARRDAAYTALHDGLERVLLAANFAEIGAEQVARASTESGMVRSRVRTAIGDFKALRLFSRGTHSETVERSKWWGLRKWTDTIEICDEVVLFAALKAAAIVQPKRRWRRRKPKRRTPAGTVMIKLFHDIARADLEVLFPGVRVVMTNMDKVMMTVPALVAGIPILIKLAPAVFVLYGILRFYFGVGPDGGEGVGEALIVASGVLALGGFLMNQWIKYERRSLRYQMEVNDTIYFHNVTNNIGIFDHIIGTAEEQDCKEVMLAYFFLLTAKAPMTEPDLDRAIEGWLLRRFALDVDFEVDDALRKLERFGILTRSGALLSVKPLPAALGELDGRWDGLFQFAAVA